jgi:hypothetical protein
VSFEEELGKDFMRSKSFSFPGFANEIRNTLFCAPKILCPTDFMRMKTLITSKEAR